MRLLVFTFAMLFTLSGFAKNCQYSTSPEKVKLTWTAYKTPLKAAVSGSFNNLGLGKAKKANSLKKLVKGMSFDIKTDSVNSSNPARDKKIYTYFFKKMVNGDSISGKIKDWSKKKLIVELKINGVMTSLPLAVEVKKNTIVANGYIDILDLGMKKSLEGINEACNLLHQGKTWSDVALNLTIATEKSCK